MAQLDFFENNIRRIKYDLSDITVGESIFSKSNNEDFFLCIKLNDNKWEVYEYTNGYIRSSNATNIIFYILPNHRIFDKEKTEWVKKYWEKAIVAKKTLSTFEDRLKRNLPY